MPKKSVLSRYKSKENEAFVHESNLKAMKEEFDSGNALAYFEARTYPQDEQDQSQQQSLFWDHCQHHKRFIATGCDHRGNHRTKGNHSVGIHRYDSEWPQASRHGS